MPSNQDLAKKLINERAFYSFYPQALQYEELEPAMRTLASSNYPSLIKGDSLMSIFEKQVKVINTTKDYIRWKLYFEASDLRATIMAKPTSSNGCLGVNGSSFVLSLDTDVYGPNDVIIIEGLAELPLLIKSHPSGKGMETLYDVALVDPDQTIDEDWINAGMMIKAQIGSLSGEAQIDGGNVHWTSGNSFIEFEVPMTSMRWDMKITNKAWMAAQHFKLNPLHKPFQDITGNMPVSFGSYDAKFKQVTDKQLDLWLAWGRAAARYSSPHQDNLTENALITGPAWYQYLESATQLYYNPYSNIIEFLRKMIPPTWNDRVPIGDRILDVYTGSAGLIQVQKAGEELDNKGHVIQTAELNYTTEKSFGTDGRNAVAIGAKQYRAFYIEPFGMVRFHYLPFLDSTTVDTRKHNGYPYSSYEYIVFNDGRGDGREDNIYISRNAEDSGYTYMCGTWTPTGHISHNGNASKYPTGLGAEKAFKIIRDETVGMVIKDPSYFTWIRPILK